MTSTRPSAVDALHRAIEAELRRRGARSPYAADADEPDPRYRAYGVRAPEMKRFISGLRPDLSALSIDQALDLAGRLIASGYGEQKTVALALLERVADHFTPARFDALDGIMRSLHGWSKIDSYTSVFLPRILAAHGPAVIDLVGHWTADKDLWLRRASVVLFTRKVATSRLYGDVALRNCEALIFDTEHLVQTGVGWCLKDQMKGQKDVVLPYVRDLRRRGVSSKITLYALRDIKGEERRAILNPPAPE